ncbi:hypothetical protein GCM10011316_28750 [Roseibium aquae]|uniref:BioF2-like acetyltransferase domain-containing protein n=1 Tax=Roseibium aquae TaxID=1323746 RepID=A0A916X314_9HYPH|nr:GNAT family N-acetyltransferase [Roseibium aquae]GGB54909.1 hypothetical protein GCM10011316_28750 [Roseibium aquae]
MPNIHLDIHPNFNTAQADWERVQAAGAGAPYQSYKWVRTWFEANGPAGAQPVIAIGKNGGTPAFVLPFQFEGVGPVKRLTFLGALNSNQNTGLWNWSACDGIDSAVMTVLLREICRRTNADILHLSNVPATIQSRTAPLLTGKEPPSPSPLFQGPVNLHYPEFLKHTRSRSTVAKLRKKHRRLTEAGPFRIIRAKGGTDFDRVLEAFFAQRTARAVDAGVPNAFGEPDIQNFIRNLADHRSVWPGGPSLCLWGLEVGGIIRATFICLEQDTTWAAYANSFANDELAVHSPAIILLMAILEAACDDPAIEVFDFGLGDEPYKHGWTAPVQLYDRLLPVSAKGRALAGLLSAKQTLKSRIRGSARAWAAVRAIRRFAARWTALH